jgi:hypothetical protein
MLASLKSLFLPKVQVFNPDRSFLVSGMMRWRLCRFIAELPGVVFTRKPKLLGSSAFPLAEFRFRDLMFQVDHGGDTGGDGLWITPKDGLPHPVELREIREHVERLVLQS